MTLFTDRCVQIFFIASVHLFYGLSFRLRLMVANTCSTICEQLFFFLLKPFSPKISHSSINFNWFSLLSHWIFDYRTLFESDTHCLIYHHFEYPENKYFCQKNKFSYKSILNTRVYINGKKNQKKSSFCFFQKH